MDVMDLVVRPVKGFAKDSIRLVNKCTKPDKKGARPACVHQIRALGGGERRRVSPTARSEPHGCETGAVVGFCAAATPAVGSTVVSRWQRGV